MAFLGMYWGEANNPNRQEPDDDEPPVQRLRVDDLVHDHTPDKRAPAKGHEGDPIQIRHGFWGDLRVVDGNARLAAARERGDKYIDGQVWD